MGYLTTLFKYDWEQIKSLAGAFQWQAKNVPESGMVEDAFDKNKMHAPIMTTADLGILYDPIYKKLQNTI